MRRTFAELGDDPEDEALHASRIAVKRARYAADLAAHELGKPGAQVRRRREAAAGHPRRPPGRGRRAGANQGAGRIGARPRERRSPPGGSSSSSATGWPPRARRGPTTGSGSTRPPGGPSAETRPGCGWRRRPGRRRRRSRCSSSTVRRTTTGRFPKGKLERGETDEECALREVEEETGLRCTLGRELHPRPTGTGGAAASACATG